MMKKEKKDGKEMDIINPKEKENAINVIEDENSNNMNQNLLSTNENININNENNNENNDDSCINKNIMFGITFLGRIIFPLYSIYGLFFIYNFIFQYLTSIPIAFYDLKERKNQAFIGIIYIFFSVFISNVMLIPTFDFLCFPFLTLTNPLSHFETFIYISNGKEQNFLQKSTDKNKKWINYFLIAIEGLYFIGFLLYIFSLSISIKDIIDAFFLILVYIYYLTLLFCYCITCGIIIFISLTKPIDHLPKKIVKINLLSYSINPIFKDNYEKVEKDFKEEFYNWVN